MWLRNPNIPYTHYSIVPTINKPYQDSQKIFIIPIPVKIAAIKPNNKIATESSSHELTGTKSLCRLRTASQTHTINQCTP